MQSNFRNVFLGVVVVALGAAGVRAGAQTSGSTLGARDYLTVPVGGLEKTNSRSRVVPVGSMPFLEALEVFVGTGSVESNATQLCLPNRLAVQKGDVLLATLYIRGKGALKKPARIEVLFEKATSPWTKSITYPVSSKASPTEWRKVTFPFVAAESYAEGEAMMSLRFAGQAQSLQVGGVTLANYRNAKTVEELAGTVPLGHVKVSLNTNRRFQTFLGLGGNFCQARYGSKEAFDNVGRYTLANLTVASARVGLPLDYWAPSPGVFADRDQAAASFQALQEMKRRGIPTIVTAWEGPTWLLGGAREQMGRRLDPKRYGECIDLILRYLIVARDKYKVTPEYFSFNEADYGVNFKFTPQEIVEFVRQAGPRFAKAGIRTKFLIGDTANGSSLAAYVKPMLEDASLAPYLGPIAFHCWDALGASEESYAAIAELGKKYKRPVWCLEAGHDAQLWATPNPWPSWDNALKTAMAYVRTIRLTNASVMSYWTYQDNYPIVDNRTSKPYPIFHVIKQMEGVFGKGSARIETTWESDDLQATATVNPDGKTTCLLVNSAGPGIITLSGLQAGAMAKVTVSSASGVSQVAAPNRKVSARGTLTFAVPIRSVTTVICR